MDKKRLILLVLIGIFLNIASVTGALISGNVYISQFNNTGICIDFSASPINQTTDCDIWFKGSVRVGQPGDEYRFYANSTDGDALMGMGAFMNISQVVEVPPNGGGNEYGPQYFTDFLYYQEWDGIAISISDGTYAVIVIDDDKQPNMGNNVVPSAIKISYTWNNQTSNTSMGGVDNSPCAIMTESQCMADMEFGCFWDFGASRCKQDNMGGDFHDGPMADCFMFNNQMDKCL